MKLRKIESKEEKQRHKNKKGLTQQIMIVIILFFVAVVLLGVYWIVSTVGPLVVGEGTNLASQIQNSFQTQSPNSSLSNASAVATTATTNILGTFELLVYLGLIGFFMGYMIIAFYVRTYPFLAFFWIFIIIFLVFFAMIISNAYQQAGATSSDLSGFYNNWGTNDYLMDYLPIIVGAFGLFGGIFLFVLISKEPESEVLNVD